VLAQEGLPLVAGELAALIGMNHDRRMRLSNRATRCLSQRSPRSRCPA
jgi:hypothetical protein